MFDKVQETESAHFWLNMLESPDKLVDHIRIEAGSVILKIVYGYTTLRQGKDPLVVLADRTMNDFTNASVPGKYLVDVMAFPTTSVISQSIEAFGADPKMENYHKWSALSSMYLGGSDTTVMSLKGFFLCMLLYPGVQRKAQEELDRVIGNERLPVSSDLKDLPYIEACMKETHRWHPVVPMGVPHASDKEDVCRGYRIPKGAMLMANAWWYTHNPAVYADPTVYNPDRFITIPTHTAEQDTRNVVSGYGRRICPGRYVADNALFIFIAQTLSVFDIKKPIINGKVVEPGVKFTTGVISHPVPYKAALTPRSEMHEQLIRKSEELYPWEESDFKELETVKC